MDFYGKTLSRTLPNGVRTFVLPRPGTNVQILCVIATGSIHEGDALGCGMSHFLEHLLFQGSRDNPGHAAGDAVDRLGGSINAYTTFSHTAVTVQAAAADAPEVIRIVTDMVRRPALAEDCFKTEREVILRECDLSDDDPGRSLVTRAMEHAFAVSPMRVPVIGYRPALEQLTVERLRRYHQERYQPHRVFWVVTGGADPELVFDAVAAQMADWQSFSRAEVFPPEEPVHTHYAAHESLFADPVARFSVNAAVPGMPHEDLPALELLCGILGQGESSRFVQLLENDAKLALRFNSELWAQKQGGLFLMAAAAQPARLDPCLSRLLRELEKLRRDGVTAAELAREKRQAETQMLLSMRTLSTLASTIASTVLSGGEPVMADRYGERLKKVTRDEIREAARRYLAEERLTTQLQRPEPRRSAAAKKPETPALKPELLPADAHRVETLLVRDASLPLVDFSIVLPGGAFFEAPEEAGLSGLVADVMSAGAGTRNERQLAAALDACGAELRFSAGRNTLIAEGRVMRQNFRRLWALLGDILETPRFEAAAFERIKVQQTAALKSQLQVPRNASRLAACRHFYKNHPYGWSCGFDPERIGQYGLEEVKDFYGRLWRFNQVKIGFAGAVSDAEAASWAEELCRRIAWRSGRQEQPEPPRFPAEPERIDVPLVREQCIVELFLPGPAVGEECSLLDVPLLLQLENGLSSPLFNRIREERHLAYSTGVRHFSGFHPGLLSFYAVTAPERAEEAAIQLREELKMLSEEGVREETFEAARKGCIRFVSQHLEQCDTALYEAVLDLFYGRPADLAWKLPAMLAARELSVWQQQIRTLLSHEAPLLVMAGGQSG